MGRHILTPLTAREQKFAEENHNLIYGFIHRYKYSIEEHYQVLIFGYLKSVQVYLNRNDLQAKYDFPFISWMYMRTEIKNHFTMENSMKRKPDEPVISLDADYAEMKNLHNIVGGKPTESEIMEKESVEELLHELSEIQRKIAEMKVDGYSNKEIYLILEIKPSTYYKEIQRIKNVLEKLLVG